MVGRDINTAKEITLKELAERNPEYINHLFGALELLMYENEFLRKIASRYSHDLRSPVTNVDMLLQLYEKAGGNPDKELYINKMVKSIKRLQEGFEELSAERKSVLLKQDELSPIFLDEVLGEVRSKLPSNIVISTNFTEGKKVISNSKTLFESLILLLEPFSLHNGIYTVEINSEKSWNGLTVNILYPEALDITNKLADTDNKETSKNKTNSNPIFGWNYYFAVLFLRTIGSTVILDETPQKKSVIQISFTQ